MKVFITGGIGRVGATTTKRLIRQGFDVRVVGIEPESVLPDVDYVTCDILDYDKIKDLMRGCDAVVHLAALPSPMHHPGHIVFQVNAAGTFNIFEAAAELEIKRVVQASSINAIGCVWGVGDVRFEYFPIDEAHPRFTTDPYSFSKQVIEDVGDYYWRRDGISSAAFRFPGVWSDEVMNDSRRRERFLEMRALLDSFLEQPEDVQTAQLADARRKALDFREHRLMEYVGIQNDDWQHMKIDPKDWLAWTYAFDRPNLWAYVHAEDAAQSIEKALTADFEGSHSLFVNSDHNWLEYNSETLLRVFFPDVTARSKPIHGSETLVSIDRVRELIGFEPEYSFPLNLSSV